MIICKCCGDVREDGENVRACGRICEQGMLVRFPVALEYEETSCECGGEYEDAAECFECGEVYPLDDMTDGLCPGCLAKYEAEEKAS